MTLEEMVRGLVRAAEFKEQAEGAPLWDTECREALEEARRRGFGNGKPGALERDGRVSRSLWRLLDAIDTLGDSIRLRHARGEGIPDDSWSRYFRAVKLITALRYDLLPGALLEATSTAIAPSVTDSDRCPSCGHADGRATSCQNRWHARGPDWRRATWVDIDAAEKSRGHSVDPEARSPRHRVTVTFSCHSCENSICQPLTMASVPALQEQLAQYADGHRERHQGAARSSLDE